jgi:hypothetical protein
VGTSTLLCLTAVTVAALLPAAAAVQARIVTDFNAAATSTALDKQCALLYKNVSDAWRSIANDCSNFDGPSKDCKTSPGARRGGGATLWETLFSGT